MAARSKKSGTPAKRDRANEEQRRKLARTLFFFNAVIWLADVVYVYFDMAVVNNNQSAADIASIFVLFSAVVFFAAGMLLGRPGKISYYFALLAATLNLIFCLMNFSNFFFLITLLVDAVILWLLYQLRRSILV
ncbi:MAG: hypothetical protein K8S20_06615 [Chloroflexi bacterium]|nr:hypothetical protein [Chloroflexota bacterium]